MATGPTSTEREGVDSPAQRRAAIQDALVAYMAGHPDACDTPQGIRTWWLKGMDMDEAMIEDVLDAMVDAGTLQGIRLAGDVVVYRARTA